MAYHRGQNSTFEFDVVVYNFYLDLQLNIHVSYFSTLLVDLTLFVSRFNFVVRSIQHSSLRNSTFNFRKYPTASQSMGVSVGSANYQNTPLVSPGNSQNCLFGDVIKMASLLWLLESRCYGPFSSVSFKFHRRLCAHVHIDRE